MFIIIHNKLINKCYFGTFGKHSVFGNGDVSNRKPNQCPIYATIVTCVTVTTQSSVARDANEYILSCVRISRSSSSLVSSLGYQPYKLKLRLKIVVSHLHLISLFFH